MDSCVSTLDDRGSYCFRTMFLALMAACVAGAVEAAECPSAGDIVDDTGVMMAGDFPAGCLVFVADSGGAFALDDAGGFVAGDRVAVTGTCTDIKNLCEPFNPDGFSNLLENVTIDRAYADCGTMELGPSEDFLEIGLAVENSIKAPCIELRDNFIVWSVANHKVAADVEHNVTATNGIESFPKVRAPMLALAI